MSVLVIARLCWALQGLVPKRLEIQGMKIDFQFESGARAVNLAGYLPLLGAIVSQTCRTPMAANCTQEDTKGELGRQNVCT